MALPPDQVVSFRAVLRYVARHPGATCDEIAGDLDVVPAVMSGALIYLTRTGRLRGEGNTRGRRYYAAGAGASGVRG